jgi:hypothetical protein
MHAFDDPRAAADGDTFDTQLQDLSGPTTTLSPQGESEYQSFWMALGVLRKLLGLPFKSDWSPNKSTTTRLRFASQSNMCRSFLKRGTKRTLRF